MRVKYTTRGIVLARTHAGEANTFVTMLTPDLGLVHARVQSLRSSGAKLGASLATFAESECVLVRGKEGWRVAGAVLEENWFAKLQTANARRRAARVSGLVLRLVAGEVRDAELYAIIREFFEALTTSPVLNSGVGDAHEAVEVVAALRTLTALGLDTGDLPVSSSLFAPPLLATVAAERSHYISRINTGIAASGL
ncbi:MAG: recombination protein O N-terminal domain-containing protein [Minisyncoccia bacterium]